MLNVILYAFYELNDDKATFFVVLFVQRTQNDVHDGVVRDVKCS